MAACNGNSQVLGKLLEHELLGFLDINERTFQGSSVLDFAANNKYTLGPISYLLNNAKKLDLDTNNIRTIFARACQCGTGRMVKYLILNSKKFGIDLNMHDPNNGCTPFQDACCFGKRRSVEIILQYSKQYNIDIDAKNNIGENAQDLAIVGGH